MKTVLWGLLIAVVFFVGVNVVAAVLSRMAPGRWLTEELLWRTDLYPHQVALWCLIAGMIAAVIARVASRRKAPIGY